MARVPELARFCRQHELKMITVADLIRYRLAHERYVHRIGEAEHATRFGRCRLIAYRNELDQEMHTAMVFGAIPDEQPALVRVQSHCLPAALGSSECDCARNLEAALRQIQAAGAGILVYLHQNSPGYAIADRAGEATLRHGEAAPRESVPGSESQVQRQTGVGAQILTDLGVRQLRLLTNHPRRLAGLEGYGLAVVEHVALGQ